MKAIILPAELYSNYFFTIRKQSSLKFDDVTQIQTISFFFVNFQFFPISRVCIGEGPSF